jgi:hypothetical protein
MFLRGCGHFLKGHSIESRLNALVWLGAYEEILQKFKDEAEKLRAAKGAIDRTKYQK